MQILHTDNAPAAVGPYSQAVRTGNLLYCSGQIALDPATGQLAGDTVAQQAEAAMKNVAAVLAEAGLTFDNVVKTTCFLKDMADFASFNEVYATFFTGNKPARSCVQAALPKAALCEVEVIAEFPQKEECSPAGVPDRTSSHMESFRDLVAGARSYRRFNAAEKMSREELEALVDLGRMSPCGANRQAIRYALCCDQEKNAQIYDCIGWAAALPDWDGPEPQERPTGYILMLYDLSLQKAAGVNEGIAAQSIFLGAREMGYGGCMLMNIKKERLLEIFGLDPAKYGVSMLIALGVPVEKVKMVPVRNNDTNYYRDENQVHYVPKRSLEEVIVARL